MKLHRFYFEEKIGDRTILTLSHPDVIHQLRRVFKFRQGDEIILFDNSGYEFYSKIITLEKDACVIQVIQKNNSSFNPKKNLTLVQSIVKKDNFEWILEKGTELGISNFFPIVSQRSEKKDLNIKRLRKILKEASEQSGRTILPEIQEPASLESVVEKILVDEDTAMIVLDPGESNSLSLKLSEIEEKKIYLFIGPEGGWTNPELNFLTQKGARVFTLGKQVLRAETAAIVASGIFLLDF
jgi:16S rRNA (uracil1498-N3)-methyltransferase